MERRQLLKAGGASAALTAMSFAIFDPREARAVGVAFKVLLPDEVTTIEALSEAIVPGAREAGVAYYVDHELASPSPRLMLRFAQLRGPMTLFYRGALSAFATSMKAQGLDTFGSLSPAAKHKIIEAMRTGTIDRWDASAVAAPVFYGMMRNDGIDVVYGSAKGFEALDIPYMPHIMPKTTW